MGRPIPEIEKEALDITAMQPILQSVVRERFGAGANILDMSTGHIKRGVYRYTIRMNGKYSADAPLSIIGKVYDDEDAGKTSFEKMQRLWKKGFNKLEPVGIKIPFAYNYLPGLRLLLMEEAPGKPLKKAIKKQIATPEQIAMFAKTLAKLHHFPLIFGEPFTIETHLEKRCNNLAAPMANDFPEIAHDISQVVETAKRRQSQNIQRDFTLAHGDFHFSQVHVNTGDYWLLDIDPLHYGDPAYDVAMVLFVMKQESAKRGTSDYIAALRDAFIAAYFAESDWTIASRIPLQEAMINLKRACKRYHWQDEDGWRDLIPQQIQQSVTCLKMMEKFPAPASEKDVVELYNSCPGNI